MRCFRVGNQALRTQDGYCVLKFGLVEFLVTLLHKDGRSMVHSGLLLTRVLWLSRSRAAPHRPWACPHVCRALHAQHQPAQHQPAPTTNPPIAAYVHLPFCKRRCFYCDFPIAVTGNQITSDTVTARIHDYVTTLLAEIHATTAINTHPLQSVRLHYVPVARQHTRTHQHAGLLWRRHTIPRPPTPHRHHPRHPPRCVWHRSLCRGDARSRSRNL